MNLEPMKVLLHRLQPVIYLLVSVLLIQSCTYTQKIKDGQTAFEQKQYDLATKMLRTEFNKSKSSSEKGTKAYQLGESYRILNQPEKSLEWYEKAYDFGYGPDALKNKAFALKEMQRYDDAVLAFEDLIVETGEPFLWRKEVAACKQASQWQKDLEKNQYKIDKLGFNTGAGEYAPSLYKDNQLVITSDQDLSKGEEVYNWTGRSFSDLFLVDLESGKISAFDSKFNTEYNEGTIAFNKDFTEAYFSRCGTGAKVDADYCKIMYSKFSNGSWTIPVIMEFVEENTNYAHPTLSEDGKTLYFATDYLDGYGGYDIYYSNKTGDGWSLPENLGPAINTEGNETYPYMDQDTLYFSSDFHVGMGGMDIFKSYKNSSRRWSPLQNLKAPINSGSDDFAYVVDYLASNNNEEILQSGYFTSNRAGKGNDDIYQFTKLVPPPVKEEEPEVQEVIDTTTVADTPDESDNKTFQYILTIKTIEKEFSVPGDPSSTVKGRVALPNTKVQVNVRDTSFTFNTNDKGEYEIELELGQYYNFFGTKSTYLNNSTSFSSRNIKEEPNRPIRRFRVDLELNKEIRGKEIRLENIYYDLDKFFIRDDAKPTLNDLARMLRENPTINIELSSHTDCRGTGSYNQWLSQKRAESAINYLIERGIAFERLVPKGYGKSKPAVNCACSSCSDDQHQANRRTAFTILD